ncbi:MAG: sigma-54-dependent transcriptional regulator [Calditrichia bacterium]
MQKQVLIVEDDINTLNGLSDVLQEEGYKVAKAKNARQALATFKKSNINLILMDYLLPDQDGIQLSKIFLDEQPEVKIIMLTAFGTVKNAVNAMKIGIYDYLTKPIDLDELLIIINRAIKEQNLISENIALKSQISQKYRFENIIGQSGKMQEVFQKVFKVANTDATVLLSGASGTGKELIARSLHHHSSRRNQQFVEINCASIPENLLESELFGHEKGAFTGAYKSKKGKFEIAHMGTLFLDEISELPLSLQSKLLRVLQEKTFTRVGGVDVIEVDVRLIAATNANLEKLMREGKFREDFYYRLNVVPILLPPLRERYEDIGILTDHFIEKYARKNSRNIKGISEKARQVLMNYEWPGNVRELENAIENSIIMSENEIIDMEDLPGYLQAASRETEMIKEKLIDIDEDMSYREKLNAFEKEIIRQALLETKGNRTRAAKKLGFTLRTLRNKINKYNL